VSFNQPKFCPTAAWNKYAFTFANQSVVGEYPAAIFINTNNTVFIGDRQTDTILIWDENSTTPIKNISRGVWDPFSIFVTPNGDIYIDDGEQNGRVQRWIASNETFVTIMNVNSPCYGLFVDTNNNLYCSMNLTHQVVKKSLDDPVMEPVRVAGTGEKGFQPNQLNRPYGIFVDVNFDLYVTDCGNDRVQLFVLGEANGITVADETSASQTFPLYCPRAVLLDAQKYLFIADAGNDRIVGEGAYGFRCLVGCYGRGSQMNQLNSPYSFTFDRFGNIFVADTGNSRIQKVLFVESSCGKLRIQYFK
ncbi:unnamed protein product, partial [Adineta ricciae]